MLAPEIEAALNAKYGLDKPIWQQYLSYLQGIVTFDLGPSFKYPAFGVNDLIREGLPVTAQTGFLAMLCVVALGIPLGIVAALNQNKWQDTTIMAIATMGVAIPSYVLATIALYLFALQWNLVPHVRARQLARLYLASCCLVRLLAFLYRASLTLIIA